MAQMKMSPEAFAALRALLDENGLTQETDPVAYNERRRAYSDANLSAVRFRFDQLYRIPYPERQAWFDTFRVYKPIDEGGLDLDDENIHTALRAILP